MNNIDRVFSSGKALIPFITAGDPSLDITEKLIYSIAKAGADLIEIGIPFSDPVAEGAVIQSASERALISGTTTDRIFEMIKKVREKCDIPLALMTYMNPIFTYGAERFMRNCSEYNVCCVIIPDLPFEEKDELKEYCEKYDIKLISLIAPTSLERISMISKEAEGFVYCVSSMGVTGVRNEITSNIGEMIKRVRAEKDIPCAVGFGISTPEQAGEMANVADGVIVGSAVMRIVAEYGENCIIPVSEYIRALKQAVKNA